MAQDARTRASYEPHYEGSPVVLGPPGGVCSIHGKHSYARARRGTTSMPAAALVRQERVRRAGAGFTLLAFGADDAAVAGDSERGAVARRAAEGGVATAATGERQATKRDWCWSGPDQYVAWSGDRVPHDPVALLERVTGNATGSPGTQTALSLLK